MRRFGAGGDCSGAGPARSALDRAYLLRDRDLNSGSDPALPETGGIAPGPSLFLSGFRMRQRVAAMAEAKSAAKLARLSQFGADSGQNPGLSADKPF